MEAKISIIIPVHNAVNYIYKTVDSVISQKYNNYEIILVDDGSTDGSSKLCDDLLSDNILCIHQVNGGVSKARNIGLSIATGEYILFLDSDDYLDKDALKILMSVANLNDSDIIICNFAYDYGNKLVNLNSQCSEQNYSRNDLELIITQLLPNGILSNIGTKLYRKSMLIDYDIKFDERFSIYEDITFCLKALQVSRNIYYVNRCLYYYRVNYGYSLVKSYKNNYMEATINYMSTVGEIIDYSKLEDSKFWWNQIVNLKIAVIKNEAKNDYLYFKKRCIKLSEISMFKIDSLYFKYLDKKKKLILMLFDLKYYKVIYMLLFSERKTLS